MTFDQMEAVLRERLEALPPAARAELLHVLCLPDFERAERIGEFWGNPQDQDVRRTADRSRGSDATGGARRHAERGGLSAHTTEVEAGWFLREALTDQDRIG
jgi:hypothetical protein